MQKRAKHNPKAATSTTPNAVQSVPQQPTDTIDATLARASLSLSLDCCVGENHRKPLYCVKFNHVDEEFAEYFASVGANQATVYRVSDNGAMDPVQSFVDQDKYEKFYSCEWTTSDRGTPLLAVAGLRGMIKVIDCVTFELAGLLAGHGNAVNDVKAHPVDCGLLLSASKDESIRMWNIRTWTCVAIFAGDKGHRDEILSIDIHQLGNCFVSSGMDNTIKVWSLEEPPIQTAISLSYTQPRRPGNRYFTAATEQFPVFSSNKVHTDYVDCVQWVGNLILSKSVKNRVALWAPDPARAKDAVSIMREFSLEGCELWFTKFSVCIPLDLLALGNKFGRVYVWSLSGLFDSEAPVDVTTRGSAGKTSQNTNLCTRRSSRNRIGHPLELPDDVLLTGAKRKADDTDNHAEVDHDNEAEHYTDSHDQDHDQNHEHEHEHEHEHDTEQFDNSSNAHEDACASTDMSSSPMPDAAGADSISSRATATTAETTRASPPSATCPPPPSRQQSGGSHNGKASSDHGNIHLLKKTPREKYETGRAHRASALLFHPKSTSVVRQTSFSADGRWLVCCCDDGTVWKYAVSCA